MSSAAVYCNDLCKTYVTWKKEAGFWGSLKSLFKREYIKKDALSPLQLDIQKGEIVGLLGANGAGKTTLMKMLSGIIVPSSGEVKVFGETPWHRKNAFKRKIALAMGQKNQLQWDLPALDSFRLIKEYYSLESISFQKRVDELTELLSVQDFLNIQVRRLSLGERMKVEIMASLLHSPELIMLDEPTIGLDLTAQEQLRQFFRDYHDQHRPTIILTSHYMVDITALCPRVVLLSQGKKLYDGNRETLTEVLGQEKRINLIFQRNQEFNSQHPLLAPHNPRWTNSHEVVLDIDRSKFRQVTAQILTELPVKDFSTDEVPFEAVMEKVLKQPELLHNLST